MATCSHAVVTEKTRVAMPEITIVPYPDVGGSYFLNLMPGKTGLFLALTGASIHARDCLFAGLSRHALLSQDCDSLIGSLIDSDWTDRSDENRLLVDALLDRFSGNTDMASMPEGNLESHQEQFDELLSHNVYERILSICSLETEDSWLQKVRDSLAAGSPLSALIIHRQLNVTKDLPLADVFKAEYLLSINIVRYPEFAEGVRALLIDKDRNPQWQFETAEKISADLLDHFFVPPQTCSFWPVNPLEHLGK